MFSILKTRRLFRAIILLGLLSATRGSADEVPVLWKANIGMGGMDSSPALGADGAVYVTTWGGDLLALDTDGHTRWTFHTPSNIHASPAIGEDGTIYFGGRDRNFYGIFTRSLPAAGLNGLSPPAIGWIPPPLSPPTGRSSLEAGTKSFTR
jgi:hypothetical protein